MSEMKKGLLGVQAYASGAATLEEYRESQLTEALQQQRRAKAAEKQEARRAQIITKVRAQTAVRGEDSGDSDSDSVATGTETPRAKLARLQAADVLSGAVLPTTATRGEVARRAAV
jgi:hypothetical protein